jgi:hypothetical protein
MSRLLLPGLLIIAILFWWLGPVRAKHRRREIDSEERDLEQLEAAEEEVRGLGAAQTPDEGFEGDDWGPGAAKPR